MLVYIAGRYRAKTKLGQLINIIRARKQARSLWGQKVAVICPHSNSAFMDSYDDFLLQAYIGITDKCDAVLVLPKWESSMGTVEEIKHAVGKDKPIYFSEASLMQDIRRGKLTKPTQKIKRSLGL